MKKILAVCAALLLSLSTALAQSLPPPNVAAKSWLLLDVTSGQTIAADNADLRIEPASLVKLMTVYLAFEALKDKKLTMDSMITVSEHAWKVDPASSKMFIEPKTPVSFGDLLNGVIVQSGNDASVAVAEAVAGTEDAFVVLMNREAQRMGMTSTRFANAHGLPDPNNYSTAHDLSLLASHLVADHPESYKMYSTKSFTYNKIKQQNRNRLLWLDPSVDGMKTGHTQAAGYCLIASAKRPNGTGERRLISVVLGTNSDQQRAQESQKLLNWGFQNFDTVKLYAKGAAVETVPIWKGTQNQIKLGFNHDIYVTVPRGTAEKMKPVLQRRDPLVAPVAANSQVGNIKMMVDGKALAEFPLLALEQVNQASIFGRAWDSVRLWVK